MRTGIVQTISCFPKKETELRMPYSAHLTDKIFEIKTKVGSTISRVLYFFVIGRKIVLTSGFINQYHRFNRWFAPSLIGVVTGLAPIKDTEFYDCIIRPATR